MHHSRRLKDVCLILVVMGFFSLLVHAPSARALTSGNVYRVISYGTLPIQVNPYPPKIEADFEIPFQTIAITADPNGPFLINVSTGLTENCKVPSNPFTTSLILTPSMCTPVLWDDIRGTATQSPNYGRRTDRPWGQNYNGVYFQQVITVGAEQRLIALDHGENKNEYKLDGQTDGLGPCNIVNGVRASNTVNIDHDCDHVPRSSSGDYLPSYNGFINFADQVFNPTTQQYGQAPFTDWGPIIWPANGYTVGGVKSSLGVRHPRGIVDQGFIWVFYMDESGRNGVTEVGRGTNLGQGIRVARALVSTGGRPGSWQTYCNGVWNNALPANFTKETIANFYNQQGGCASPILDPRYGTQTNFAVAKKQQGGYLGVETVVVADQVQWLLWSSPDLLHWTYERPIITVLGDNNPIQHPNTNPALTTAPSYPIFLSADGLHNDLIDDTNFYVIGSAAGTNGTGAVNAFNVKRVPNTHVVNDYDGDGKTDLAVWRPSTGYWYVNRSSIVANRAEQHGVSGDIPVPGDYDHDGKTDLAVWRPSTGKWIVHQSTTGVNVSYPSGTASWGTSGDTPVPGDYDGDGKTDYAVVHPDSGYGHWKIHPSGGGVDRDEIFGFTGDKPVPGDYDGDGKTDLAVWQSTGTQWQWVVHKSTTGANIGHVLGASGDIPVPGDYDGDGKTDYAVVHPDSGYGHWKIHPSGGGAIRDEIHGVSGDIPVPGDYDQDHKTDLAVWRPSTGHWYVHQSTTGTNTDDWLGSSSDKPVPGDYDNDGKTDLAVWQNATGSWTIHQSSKVVLYAEQHGVTNDIPVPSDYDGDGKTDLAVWRPFSSSSSPWCATVAHWYVHKSSTGTNTDDAHGCGASASIASDVPVPADYDSDGKADLTVWRPSTTEWIIHYTMLNVNGAQGHGIPDDIPVPGDYDGDGITDFAVWQLVTHTNSDGARRWIPHLSSNGINDSYVLGTSAIAPAPPDIPVPGDYDGDGKTDYAVWHPGSDGYGHWQIHPSGGGANRDEIHGLANDKPVPGDYDGDGKTDLAVWRSSTGHWYIHKSSTGTNTDDWLGVSGDIPK